MTSCPLTPSYLTGFSAGILIAVRHGLNLHLVISYWKDNCLLFSVDPPSDSSPSHHRPDALINHRRSSLHPSYNISPSIIDISFTISLIISYYHHRLHHLHSIVAIFHAFPPHQIHPHRTPVLSSPPIPWIYKKTSTTVKYFRNNNDDPDFPFLLPWSWNRARRRYSKSIFHILFSNEYIECLLIAGEAEK